jgi:hypothetical protein
MRYSGYECLHSHERPTRHTGAHSIHDGGVPERDKGQAEFFSVALADTSTGDYKPEMTFWDHTLSLLAVFEPGGTISRRERLACGRCKHEITQCVRSLRRLQRFLEQEP